MFDTLLPIMLINIACSSFDGAAFLYAREFPGLDGGPAIVMPETGPARYLAGEYPTAFSFFAAGCVEVAALTVTSYLLKRIGIKKTWWVPQLSISIYHAYLGADSIRRHHLYIRKAKENNIL